MGKQSFWVSLMELLGSMRFAISLLTLICIASAIGTVVGQADPWVNYVNQFGPFWASFFEPMGLFRIYNAPWFIAVMAFLVVSTSLCVYRNTPKMIKEMRVYRENIRENSLRAFAHRWEGRFKEKPSELPGIVTEWLEHKGIAGDFRAGQGDAINRIADTADGQQVDIQSTRAVFSHVGGAAMINLKLLRPRLELTHRPVAIKRHH